MEPLQGNLQPGFLSKVRKEQSKFYVKQEFNAQIRQMTLENKANSDSKDSNHIHQ